MLRQRWLQFALRPRGKVVELVKNELSMVATKRNDAAACASLTNHVSFSVCNKQTRVFSCLPATVIVPSESDDRLFIADGIIGGWMQRCPCAQGNTRSLAVEKSVQGQRPYIDWEYIARTLQRRNTFSTKHFSSPEGMHEVGMRLCDKIHLLVYHCWWSPESSVDYPQSLKISNRPDRCHQPTNQLPTTAQFSPPGKVGRLPSSGTLPGSIASL